MQFFCSHSLAKEVNWKLLFNKLFALEIKKESRKGRPPFKNTMALLKEHTSWSPLSFEEVIAKTLEAKTSREAYKIREKIYMQDEILLNCKYNTSNLFNSLNGFGNEYFPSSVCISK